MIAAGILTNNSVLMLLGFHFPWLYIILASEIKLPSRALLFSSNEAFASVLGGSK